MYGSQIQAPNMQAKEEKATYGTVSERSPFRPVQYLGNKLRALDQIVEATAGLIRPGGSVCDLFTGTTVVAQAEIDAAAIKLHPRSKPATRKRQVYIPMSAVLHHAARKGWCTVPVFQHPRVKQPATKWSTPERLAQLLPHCGPKLRRLVVFLTYTGARISEALRVDWEADVFLERRSVILRRTKNGKPRTVHLPTSLLAELEAVEVADRKGKLFGWAARKAVYGPLRRACKRAGVEYLPPHQQGRHTYATWLRAYAGMDLIGLKEAGGWESLSSVERYAHLVPNEAAKAADKLPDVHSVCTDPDNPEKPK